MALAISTDASDRVRTVKFMGSRPAFTCGQLSGMETGAPARARGDKGATAVDVMHRVPDAVGRVLEDGV